MCRRTEEKVVPTVIMPSLNIRISSNASALQLIKHSFTKLKG